MDNLKFLSISLFCESFFVAAIALFVLFKNPRSRVNIVFSSYSFTGFIFLFFTAMMFLAKDEYSIIFWDRMVYLGVVFMPSLMFHLGALISKREKEYKIWIILGYVISIIFFPISQTDYFLKDLFRYKWGFHAVAQPFHHIFISIFLVFIIGYLYIVYQNYHNSSPGQERNQAKYYLIASVVLMLTSMQFMPAYKIGVYPVGFFFIVVYLAIVGYAMVKYRLMDIRIAATRTSVFIAVYTIILGFPFVLTASYRDFLINRVGINWFYIPLISMAVLATVGPFIYIYINKRIEDRLLREQRRYQDTLKQASLGMTRIRDLNKLFKLIVHILTRTVRLNYAAIYFYNEKADKYMLSALRDHELSGTSEIASNSALIELLDHKKETIVYEEVKRKNQDIISLQLKDVEKTMVGLCASLVVPCFTRDKLLGFLVMGEKLSKQIYTQEDINIFSVLSHQTALAIENALFYQEVKETQTQLFQAEKMATIGTMADGLSHQINNRFNAMSIIAEDSLDTMGMMNLDGISEENKKLIEEFRHAFDRIKNNALQGGEVVRGLLKYSRTGKTGLEALTIDQILDSTIEMVRYKVKVDELNFLRLYSKELPFVLGNLTQLQEVFFNLIDNANDAIHERMEKAAEIDYRGTIQINAHTLPDGFIRIIFEDNGLGVKKEDQEKLFTPFFTTKVSSRQRQGTGLGLYVIKKIIGQYHNGRIFVESGFMKGTKFIIELPQTKKTEAKE